MVIGLMPDQQVYLAKCTLVIALFANEVVLPALFAKRHWVYLCITEMVIPMSTG